MLCVCLTVRLADVFLLETFEICIKFIVYFPVTVIGQSLHFIYKYNVTNPTVTGWWRDVQDQIPKRMFVRDILQF